MSAVWLDEGYLTPRGETAVEIGNTILWLCAALALALLLAGAFRHGQAAQCDRLQTADAATYQAKGCGEVAR